MCIPSMQSQRSPFVTFQDSVQFKIYVKERIHDKTHIEGLVTDIQFFFGILKSYLYELIWCLSTNAIPIIGKILNSIFICLKKI